MLEVLYKVLSFTLMIMISIIFVMKLENKKNIMKIPNIIIIIIMILIPCIMDRTEYSGIQTISIYFLNIAAYSFIFRINKEKAVIYSSLILVYMFIMDLLASVVLSPFFDPETIRENWSIRIIPNIIYFFIFLKLISCDKISTKLKNIVEKLEKKRKVFNVLFLIILIILFSFIEINIVNKFGINKEFFINTTIMILLIILLGIFFNERSEMVRISNEYDTLFSYTQNFEDWIEKEQLNRHEYKNQLAVLRCLTKEKKVKNKIDEILEDNINIEGQAVTNLKNLPKGGIKGLMYYKAAIAQKNKVNLITDVSLERNGILTKLSEKDIRILCKLIGIYFDNAIEAAAESRKKNLTIEVYELRDRVNFVFSNTFKRHKNMNDRNKKGISSKGEGRGNGLYFASKLIDENSWLSQRQEIIDNYYIQELYIMNPKKSQKKKGN